MNIYPPSAFVLGMLFHQPPFFPQTIVPSDVTFYCSFVQSEAIFVSKAVSVYITSVMGFKDTRAWGKHIRPWHTNPENKRAAQEKALHMQPAASSRTEIGQWAGGPAKGEKYSEGSGWYQLTSATRV